jgi:hypothetical protein
MMLRPPSTPAVLASRRAHLAHLAVLPVMLAPARPAEAGELGERFKSFLKSTQTQNGGAKVRSMGGMGMGRMHHACRRFGHP